MFTATQITAFFTEATQMGLSARTRQALEDEGIKTVAYIYEWEYDEWDQFTQNCKRPPQIVDKKMLRFDQPTCVQGSRQVFEAFERSVTYWLLLRQFWLWSTADQHEME